MTIVSRKDIARVVARQLQQGKAPKNIARELAQYLIAERRSGELEAIMRDVQAIRETDGITEATVTSAFPLSVATKKQITALLNTDHIVMNEEIDLSVIGGVRVEAGSRLIDATIRKQLDQIKQGVPS